MKSAPLVAAIVVSVCWFSLPAFAHGMGSDDHDQGTLHYDFTVRPPTRGLLGRDTVPRNELLLAWAAAHQPLPATVASGNGGADWGSSPAARVTSIFTPFAPKVRTRADDRFVYVESDSMPDHRMMVGITAWQQQVPIPQAYTGENAWRIPLHPVVAPSPLSAKSHFFRGAIALAANGVPIFNPIKNDGRTDTFLAGELDEFGGHCGRADDYHYHIAPLHLQRQVGSNQPVAFALDGYAIYGLAEPGGGPVTGLDGFNGHERPGLGYHYHASRAYPYLNGGFHGEVTERDGQVDPQPRARGVRPALQPLRGARITDFGAESPGRFRLTYEISGTPGHVRYALGTNGVTFEFIDTSGVTDLQTYPYRSGTGPGDGRPEGGRRRGGAR